MASAPRPAARWCAVPSPACSARAACPASPPGTGAPQSGQLHIGQTNGIFALASVRTKARCQEPFLHRGADRGHGGRGLGGGSGQGLTWACRRRGTASARASLRLLPAPDA
jgi:hypothetical protein